MLQHMTSMQKEVIYRIFLDLHKAYDALDSRCSLDILTAYGVGPQALHILRRYWDWIYMVARAVGYFGD